MSLDFVLCNIYGHIGEQYFPSQGVDAALNLPPKDELVYRVNAICLPRLPNDGSEHGYSDLDSKIHWLAGYGTTGLVRREAAANEGGPVHMDGVMRPYEYFGYTRSPPASSVYPGVFRLKMLRAKALQTYERWDMTEKCLNPDESVLDYAGDDVRRRIDAMGTYTTRTGKVLAVLPSEGDPNQQPARFRQSPAGVSLICVIDGHSFTWLKYGSIYR